VRSYLNKKREELKREEEGDQVGRAGTIFFASGRPTKAFLRRMRPRILPGMPYVLRRLLRFGETLIQYTGRRVESHSTTVLTYTPLHTLKILALCVVCEYFR
jgi:hypothetical protein